MEGEGAATSDFVSGLHSTLFHVGIFLLRLLLRDRENNLKTGLVLK